MLEGQNMFTWFYVMFRYGLWRLKVSCSYVREKDLSILREARNLRVEFLTVHARRASLCSLGPTSPACPQKNGRVN